MQELVARKDYAGAAVVLGKMQALTKSAELPTRREAEAHADGAAVCAVSKQSQGAGARVSQLQRDLQECLRKTSLKGPPKCRIR